VTAPPATPASASRWPWFRARAGVPEAVQDAHLALLFAVALASFFEEYDLAMLTSALKHIAAGLGIPEQGLPDFLGLIRLGALPAFLFIPYADRVGRRGVFLFSVVAMGVLTLLTAFSRTAGEFVVLQLLTRTFFVTGSAVAVVLIAEEFPAGHRGYGVGLLGALAVTGHGFAAILFAFIDKLPYGWRLLYGVGVVPVLLYPWLSKRVIETRRFEEHRRSRAGLPDSGILGWMLPLRQLVRERPLRAAGIALAGLLPSFGIIGTFQFTGYFTQTVRGWSPRDYATMVVVAGGVGVFGNVLSGSLADRFGRRIMGASLLVAFPLFATLFYRGPGWVLPIAWAACVFTSQGGRAILRALATELFPTAHRGAASGIFTILDVVGAAVGLFTLGAVIHAPGQLAITIPWVAAVTTGGGLVVVLFPETRDRELEDI
jgi:MFS family permease